MRPFAIVAGAVALVSCARETPAVASAPPDRAAPRPETAELSRFSVPLAYDFSSMIQVVERAVPTSFGSLDSIRMIGTDDHRHYAFAGRRGPFTAFAVGRELHLRATVRYQVRGYYKPLIGPTISVGCGNEREQPRIVIELAAPITLSESWHLASKARLVKLAPASSLAADRCDMGILNTDMTDAVVSAARSAVIEHLPDVDRRIASVNLHDRFTEWWALLAKPIPLAEGVWLVLGPERLRIGRVSGRERVLSVPVSLDARPRVVTGTQPPADEPTPLPPLGHDTISNGFHILIDGDVHYGAASRALTEAFGQRVVETRGRKIRVERVTVEAASKGKLALTLHFSGDATGALRLVGSPKYDATRGQLTVPDLEYDIDVNDPLVKTYSWLRSESLQGKFRDRAHFPVAAALTRGRALLLEGLNRKIGDALTISATVDSVAVRGLYVTLDGLVIRGEATGRAKVTVVPVAEARSSGASPRRVR